MQCITATASSLQLCPMFSSINCKTTLGHMSLECKTHTILILMHQMCISTNKVSSVMHRPKTLEIIKIVKTIEEPGKNPRVSIHKTSFD
jgi:hypothetical protein